MKLYTISKPCKVNKDQYVLITTYKRTDDGIRSNKEYLVKNIHLPCKNNDSYNLLNMLTDYEYANKTINNPYKLLAKHALPITGFELKIVNNNVLIDENTVCVVDLNEKMEA